MSSNNGQMDLLISGIVIALLVAMFTGGALMIVESTSAPDETKQNEPNKMYFGIAFLIAAAIMGMVYVYTLYKGGNSALRVNANGYPV